MPRPKPKARLPLLTQLLVALTLLGTVPVVVLGLEQTLAARAAARESAEREARVVSSSLARELGRVIQTRADVVRALASSFAERDPKRSPEPIAKLFLRHFPSFYVILGTDADGVTLAAAPETRADGSPTLGTYYGDRAYFKKLREGASFASELLKSRTTGKPSVILAAPIQRQPGKLEGVAIAGVNLDLIQQAVDRVTATAPGLATVVVDDSGRVVVSAGGTPMVPLQDLSREPLYARAHSNAPEPRHTAAKASATRSGSATRVESEVLDWTVVATWSEDSIQRRTSDALVKVLLFALTALVLGGLLAFALSRAVARPVTRLAAVVRAIAAGDLRARAPTPDRFDSQELAQLCLAIDEMQTHTELVIAQLGRTTETLLEVTLELEGASRQMLLESHEQELAVNKSAGAIASISASLGNLDETVRGIFGAAESTSTSVSGFNLEIARIAESLRNLADTIQDASSYIRSMGEQVEAVSANADRLQTSVASTNQSIEKLADAVLLTAQQANERQELALNAMEVAAVGFRSVHDTIAATKDIKASFGEVEAAVERLSDRSAAIGEVVQVIDRVLEGTHLLAINASIIAAEAGEHGRRFRVVAEQVKSVASETAASTAEISKLVSTVQGDIKGAVDAVRRGQTTVETGQERSAQAGERLQGIIENSRQAATLVSQIDQTTREQALQVREVQDSLGEVSKATAKINQTLNAQRQVQQAMAQAILRVRNVGNEVQGSTEQQRKSSAQMSDGLRGTAQRLRVIAESLESQGSGHSQIQRGLRVFDDAARANVSRAKQLDDVVGVLRARLGQLARELSAFKVE